ncbi:MAG TPA: hypothetical protein VFS21_07075 [Roseiflexaceae bacterium]|nr:hypothetical protein [Roseiflexaceae bacterium]
MTDPTHALKEQLTTLRQTARYLLQQAAAHGSEVHLPPEIRHRLDATRSSIQQCKDALRAQGVVVDDRAGVEGQVNKQRVFDLS